MSCNQSQSWSATATRCLSSLVILFLKCYTPFWSLICMGNYRSLEDAVEFCSVSGVWYRGSSCEGQFASLLYQELELLLQPQSSALQRALLRAGVGAHGYCHSSQDSRAAGQRFSWCYVRFKAGWACWQQGISRSCFSAVITKTYWSFIYKQVCKPWILIECVNIKAQVRL